MRLIGVHTPQSESEAIVIVGMLEAHEIPVFVHGRYLSSLMPGPSINAYNTQTITVPEAFVDDALELLTEFRNEPAEYDPTALTATDKLRVFVEWLLCGWHVPFRRERKVKTDESLQNLDGP
jgi:hypothetical protein